MKRVIRVFLSFILCSAYLLASTGFGVHECNHRGTKDLLIINSDKRCDDIHSHCSCNSEGCRSNEHDGNCCDTEMYHLDIDVENFIKEADDFSSVVKIQHYNNFSTILLNKATALNFVKADTRHGPLPFPESLLPVISQWRL